jgi:hypothetical protein
MSRRWLGMLGVVLTLALVGGPVAAKDFTGSEEQRKTFPCPKKGESVPENQSPPKKKDCRTKKQKTYKGTYYSNDVKCEHHSGNDIGVARLYTSSGEVYGIGVCNDQSTFPVQGRVVLQGNMDDGLTAYADGDKDNSPDQAQGYARFDLSSDGGQFGCGSEDGRMDASAPGKDHDQSNCG